MCNLENRVSPEFRRFSLLLQWPGLILVCPSTTRKDRRKITFIELSTLKKGSFVCPCVLHVCVFFLIRKLLSMPHFCMLCSFTFWPISVQFGCFIALLAVKSKLIFPQHISLCLLAEQPSQINGCAFIFQVSFFSYIVLTSFESVALNSWGNVERLANCCLTSTGATAGSLEREKAKSPWGGHGPAIWSRIYKEAHVVWLRDWLSPYNICVQGHKFVISHREIISLIQYKMIIINC